MNRIILYAIGIFFNINTAIIKLLPRSKTKSSDAILVVQPDLTLGDKVWAIDFLRVVCDIYNGQKIVFISDGAIDDIILSQCPDVRIVPFSVKSDKGIHLLWRIPKIIKFCSDNDLSGFQKAYVPRIQDDQYAVFIAFVSGAREIIGFSEKSTERKSILNKGQDKLLTSAFLPPDHSHHNLIRQLYLLNDQPEYQKFIDNKPAWKTAEKLVKFDEGASVGVVICPSYGHSKLKAWPVGHYVGLINQLTEQIPQVKITLIGGKGDVDIANQIMSLTTGVNNLTAQLKLKETMSEMSKNHIFIGADTGALHVADAVGLTCIGIFGSSCDHQFHPFRNQKNTITLSMPCNPCNTGHKIDRCGVCKFQPQHPCMEGLHPDMVLSAVVNIINNHKHK